MSRRHALDTLDSHLCEHPGLRWQRLLPGLARDQVERHLNHATAAHRASNAYQAGFQRWSAAMDQWPGTRRATITAVTPVAIGLGGASPTETGITLHHTYGVPYLPGSALKGLARRAASQTSLTDRDRAVLFGSSADSDAAGYVTFWDGWLEPTQRQPLARDVMTPHHPQYYATEGDTPPTDFDDPTPLAFLTIKPRTTFHIALSAPTAPEWVEVAFTVLARGLSELGLGARTAAGYGTLHLDQTPS